MCHPTDETCLRSPVVGVKEPNRHCTATFGKSFDGEKPREEPVDRAACVHLQGIYVSDPEVITGSASGLILLSCGTAPRLGIRAPGTGCAGLFLHRV